MKAENAWKWMPFWVLFSTVIFAVWRIQLALGDPHFAAVENYYEAAENWDAHMEEVRASEALGWKVVFQTTHAQSKGNSDVAFVITDRDGHPVTGLTSHLKAFHNAYPKQFFEPQLLEAIPGTYATQIPLRRSGIWRWQLQFTRGEELWSGDLREIVDREIQVSKS
ncbi:MAG: FixH family protein [Planctomycetota bacterium]